MSSQPLSLSPDLLYAKSKEQLLRYENARFNSLLSSVPDCYTQVTDSTIWGYILRAVAQELARYEYDVSYSLVSLEPQYLTPPDIKRKYADPLYVNGSYPQAGMSDVAYKAMLVALLAAYPEGTTVQAIQDVITAYTGQVVEVQELYKLIGNGFYDDSDRNTIKVSLNASGPNPISTSVLASDLATLSGSLFGAIELAKAAHIGLDYSIVFGTDEDFAALVSGITDTLVIQLDGVEGTGLEPVFTHSPYLNPASPNTQLVPDGVRVGSYMAMTVNAAAYAALLSDAMRAEYVLNPDGVTYTLNPANYNDILFTDATGAITGAVSKAVGVLAPELNKVWAIKSDSFQIYLV